MTHAPKDQPPPRGRPTLYDPAYCERMVEFCGQGYSLTAFAGEIGVCRETISEWCRVHPDFSVAASCAKALRARWWEDQARKVAENGGPGGQATMVIFGLKNHAPDDYREKIVTEHTGPGGGPIQSVAMTQEKFEEVARKVAADV